MENILQLILMLILFMITFIVYEIIGELILKGLKTDEQINIFYFGKKGDRNPFRNTKKFRVGQNVAEIVAMIYIGIISGLYAKYPVIHSMWDKMDDYIR